MKLEEIVNFLKMNFTVCPWLAVPYAGTIGFLGYALKDGINSQDITYLIFGGISIIAAAGVSLLNYSSYRNLKKMRYYEDFEFFKTKNHLIRKIAEYIEKER